MSLIYSLFNRSTDAALKLLDLFQTDPSFVRSEIAPLLFEELFLIHFLPVLEWYNEQRSGILSNSSRSLASKYDSDDQSVVVSPRRLLKNMNDNQASELKDLERSYEEILDENCRLHAVYFTHILQNDNQNEKIDPPAVVLRGGKSENENENENSGHQEDEKLQKKYSMKNGRYNPMWSESDQSGEFNARPKNLFKFPSFYPERVSPRVMTEQEPSRFARAAENYEFDPERESFSNDNLSDPCSSDSDAELEASTSSGSFISRRSQTRKSEHHFHAESSRSPIHLMKDTGNPPGGTKHGLTPPKDFVCPITSQIFDDPVTLETGQTYERKAIQEWLERGNSTCPITRQKLQSAHLPSTNYVLKRLIASWLEQNSDKVLKQSETPNQENQSRSSPLIRSPSPKFVKGQSAKDSKFYEIRYAITKLCESEVLRESEMAVLQIERFCKESKMEADVFKMISEPEVINAFVEILFNSSDSQVLRTTLVLLSDLGSRDKRVLQSLCRVDSDIQCIISLFKKGLLEAVVLIYLLHPFTMRLLEMEMVDSLLAVIKTSEEELLEMCMNPKAVSVLLLGQLLKNADEIQTGEIIKGVISEDAIESIVGCLDSEAKEERMSAMSVLSRCMLEDGKTRNIIASKAELTPILEGLRGSKDAQWFEIVKFLSQLVRLERRTSNEQILHFIKDVGTFSTMHTLMTCLQMAPLDQRPILAGLLLQLDLLTEPRKMSIFREEAMDALISCLKSTELPAAQIAAAETIIMLQGRYSYSGESVTRTFLFKRAGLIRSFKLMVLKDQQGSASDDENPEEEKVAEGWEKKIAFALVSHEFGLVFEALAEGLRSRNAELSSACFVSATWLVHMLTVLPDTGVRGAARTCLLKRFVSIFKSSKDNEDKVLAMLALSSFISDPEGLQELTANIKDILKGLRELKRSSSLAIHMLKILSEEHESSSDLWSHRELVQEDCSKHGEVLSLASCKDHVFSGHADGTIKVWTVKGGKLLLQQEYQEHTRAVTCMAILPSVERLYSGSNDRTVRVWSFGRKGLRREQVIELKEYVSNLVVSNNILCFTPQGAGIKVLAWSGSPKILNPKEYIKSLALEQGKLYCGSLEHSIQEVDLATGAITTIQSGSRKLLSKGSPIYAMQVSDGLLYSASTPTDGAAIKIWSISSYKMVGSLPSTSDVRSMISSSDLMYLGCKGGLVEVWSKKKQTKVETLHTGASAKILCMALTSNEEILVAGTSDGKIQAWGLN